MTLKDADLMEGEVKNSYTIESEGVPTCVQIILSDYVLYYKLVIPHVDIATLALLDDIKDRLISGVEMTTSEILDPKLLDQLKSDFTKQAREILNAELPELDEEIKDHFVISLIHELLGLDEIEYFLNDLDFSIFSFWHSILNRTEDFIALIHKTPVTLKEWKIERQVYKS